MSETIPLFTSHYSFRSILTLEKQGDSELDGPDSIIDCCIENKLKELILVDSNPSGFLQAHLNCKSANLKLIFGLKLICTQKGEDKSDDSLKKDHKIIIFIKNTEGWKKLIKIYSKAATDYFYYTPRTDFDFLNSIWDDKDLKMSIPFYDSFLHKNNLELGACIPDFSKIRPTFFVESNNLPFDALLREKVNSYAGEYKYDVLESQSIYYRNRSDFSAYATYRMIKNRSCWTDPKLSHFSSDSFCFESFLLKR